MQLHIGIDDTDSTSGGCTTYVAARLVEKLTMMRGVRFIDYPNIIRLNPNIPYKTRGNAAVALRIKTQNSMYDEILETSLNEVETASRLGSAGTDPALIILEGQPSIKIKHFSQLALRDVLSEKEAVRLVKASGAFAAAYGSGLGLVGALAAIGQTLTEDHTFELIAYRTKGNCGSRRRVDEASVKLMDEASPGTFNNYDYSNRRALIMPHGPDPVLFGIRGEYPKDVREAFRLVRAEEPIERWVIFRTNHGTDAHLCPHPGEHPVKPNQPAVLQGAVSEAPRRTQGGHVFFNLTTGSQMFTCAAYEPTGVFRNVVANLLPGDEVTVYGGVRFMERERPLTINLEKIKVNRLLDKKILRNPICPVCGKGMKSAGRAQGYKCDRCGLRRHSATKRIVKEPRVIGTGLYLPTLKAHRHLTKPLSRYGREKKWNHRPPSGTWHYP